VIACVVALGGVAFAQPGPDAGIGSGSGSGPVLVHPPLDAGAPEVSASASPSAVMLGGTFTLFVTVAFDPGVEVNLREPLELGPAFEMRRRDSRDSVRADGKRVRDYQLEIIAWDLGDLQIPPVAVTFTFGGHAGQVETNAVPIRVAGMLGETVDDPKLVRPLEPPTRLDSRDLFWLWIALAGGVAGAILATLLILRASRRKHVELTGGFRVGGKLDTPSERALARLLSIEKSGVLVRDDSRKNGYDAMNDVVREYLGARYRIATRDLTSYELGRRLDGIAPGDELLRVGAWLERCDIVKYGGVRAAVADADATLGAARELIVSTTASIPAPLKEAA
jgi:hypothetical protein